VVKRSATRHGSHNQLLGMLRLSELNHDEALKIGKLGGCRRGDDECERESVQRYNNV
jgi:hypothetical protein